MTSKSGGWRRGRAGVRWWGLTLACATASAHLVTSPARACLTEGPPAALIGVPRDGDIAVPTDVIPIFDKIVARIADADVPTAAFELVADTGETIALSPRLAHVWHFALVPAQPLRPQTRYTVRGHWTDGLWSSGAVAIQLSFTTGDGPTPAPPEPPQATLEHYQITGASLSSCDVPVTGSCVAVPADATIQVTFIDSLGQEHTTGASDTATGYLYTGPFPSNLSGIDQGTDDRCAVVRTRAPNGSLSAPTTLCGPDAPLYQVHTAKIKCTTSGLEADGQILQSPGNGGWRGRAPGAGAGCAVGGPATASPAALPLALLAGAIALAGALRRSRRRLLRRSRR